MNARLGSVLLVVAVSIAPATYAQQKSPEGRAIGFTCSGCHGPEGESLGAVPEVRGESVEELTEDLLAFKSGAKQGTIMNRIARGYTDEELRAVARYYSQVE